MVMENLYTTGQFAKMANVTERTIRYYDKIGLLKPSFVMQNGYRKYSDKDFFNLQKILSLRYLGFPIEEIFPIILNENDINIQDSFKMQIELLDKKITHMQSLKEALKSANKNAEKNDFDWKKVIDLVRLTTMENDLVEQYKNSTNLTVRINLHEKYSVNKIGWFQWLFGQIDFTRINRLLEIGCGNGKLWEENKMDLRNREIFLSDASEGMVNEVRQKLGKNYNCIVAECELIPFKDSYFDAIIANHVLFYVNDIEKGLEEITRVLKKNEFFYCSTYGIDHMKEISDLVKEFDERIYLSENHLYEKFGLENGEILLNKYFSKVTKIDYEDYLVVDKVQPLIDYILSCHGNQNEYIGKRMDEFKEFVSEKINKDKPIKITKNAGLFICQL